MAPQAQPLRVGRRPRGTATPKEQHSTRASGGPARKQIKTLPEGKGRQQAGANRQAPPDNPTPALPKPRTGGLHPAEAASIPPGDRGRTPPRMDGRGPTHTRPSPLTKTRADPGAYAPEHGRHRPSPLTRTRADPGACAPEHGRWREEHHQTPKRAAGPRRPSQAVGSAFTACRKGWAAPNSNAGAQPNATRGGLPKQQLEATDFRPNSNG